MTLPDGATLDLPDGATGLDAARAIGPKLAAATAAVEVDGELRDLRLPLHEGAQLKILRVGDEDALRVLRHSTAHVLAEAVQRLYPTAKIAIGPAIEDGFYYDFEFPDGAPGEADLGLGDDLLLGHVAPAVRLALGGGGAQAERVHRVVAELIAERRVHELVLLDERQPLELGRHDGRVEVIERARRVDDRDLGAGKVRLDLRLDLGGRRHALGTLPEGFVLLRP